MKNTKYILAFVIAAFFFVACKKDHSVLGVDVQPSSDVLGAVYSDSAKVIAHTVGYDTIPSFNDRYKFLGSNQDPQFGRTDVGLYTNANLPNGITNVTFGSDPNLVSAEIILTLSSLEVLGTGTNALTYSVFPVSTALDKSLVYYNNNNTLHNKNALLANYTGTYTILNNKLVLRIPIDPNYAQSILSNTQYVIDNATFQSIYKGFYITSEGSNLNPVSFQGNIGKFDLEDDLSGFYLYYQNGAPSATKENKTFRFTFNGGDVVRYNTIKYNKGTIANNNLYSQLIDKDTTKGKQNLFLKGLGGTRVKLFIPSIKNYSDSFPISVNRAELILNVDPVLTSPGGIYPAPPKLSLLAIEENSKETYVLDQLTETDLVRYDGSFDYGSNRYVFNISRHVQSISRGAKPNYGFYLVIADPSPLYTARRDNYYERVILAGSDNATLKPKFNISYVQLRHDK